jgi:AraC-like DNA-binding protein
MTALQLNILLLSLGAVQGILVFFLLYKKRRALPGYIFLATYLAVMLLQVTMKIAGKGWLMTNIDPLYQFSYQLPFLYGPLLYLFVVRFTSHRRVTPRDWLHFLPGIAVMAVLIFPVVYRFWPGFYYVFFAYQWTGPLQVISIVAYHLVALQLLKKHLKRAGEKFSATSVLRMKWIRQFTLISMVVCSVVAIVICLMYFKNPYWYNVRFGFIGLTFFIYWISYKVWSQPELFSVIRGYSGNEAQPVQPPVLTVHLPVKKYSNSGLGSQEMNRIIAALETRMKADKPYLDPQLTIDELAGSINSSRHHLSQAMNEQLDQTFYDYINQYRVAEAKTLLADPARASHKIAAIAFDAGFNSISTFNDVFKKIAGQTPTQYRKKADENRLKRQRV